MHIQRLMTDGAHDMGSIPLLISGVAHRFAVNCKAFVLFPVGFFPLLQGIVQMQGIDTDEDIANDVLVWNDRAALLTTAPETLARLLAKAVGPIRDGSVSARREPRISIWIIQTH